MLTPCSYGKFGRILLEIAPVSVTETCFHNGAEGEHLESQSERGDKVKREKGCSRCIAMVQQLALHQLALVIFFPWLSGLFFLQHYVIVIKKKVGGRQKLLLPLLRTPCSLLRRAQCLVVGALGAKHLYLFLTYFLLFSVFQLLLNRSCRTHTGIVIAKENCTLKSFTGWTKRFYHSLEHACQGTLSHIQFLHPPHMAAINKDTQILELYQ